ncbi:hypothetical protein QWY31_01465 [Cytophagales bacterium LB-30]|uniref:Uncharacterized protein n=1 Tax=Shiella aurantiaca TaxID=3058365 RepID=A0ABT8F123_9BACT|nr:hypothetical protein [Shiella aurantiaca]MDN4164145.1 hypothetical protein [Shiella aurantiaca]
MEADSLHLYDYPLDYEIEVVGDYYIDPNVNPTEGKWFYTAVPVTYSVPSEVETEILADLFLPESLQEENPEGNRQSAYNSFLDELEFEALRITGNLPEGVEENTRLQGLQAKTYPSGTVMVRNTDNEEMIPVVGVKVRTRRAFSFGKGFTNEDGEYRVDKAYRYDCHYTLIFENEAGFKVWNSMVDISEAQHYVGSHNQTGFDFNIDGNSRAWPFATVNNAAVRYLEHSSNLGIPQPPSGLRIAALNREGWSSAPMLRKTWGVLGFTTHSQLATFLLKANQLNLSTNVLAIITKFIQPDMIISASRTNGTEDVYGVVFHEMAHGSHFSKVGSSYWIKYINYIMTYGIGDNGPYGDGTGANAGYCGIGEQWGNYFSAVCMDREWPLGDGVGEYLFEIEDWYNPGFLLDVDNIADITTPEIYSCLSSTSFASLINCLKTKTNNDEQVDAAFTNYTDWPE